ncbi:MAG: glycoside hydrolase family 15 protein [Candidatus Thiodiazotropha sp.]
MSHHKAPGTPGIEPSWSSSDKDLVGTAIGPARLWYTLGHGILNEVYHPRIDIPQIRDLGFIVADDQGFWVELKRQDGYEMILPASGIPLPTLVHRHPRFTFMLRICPDPERDVLLLEISLQGDEGLRPYVLLSPHLGGTGQDNRAWSAQHRGRRMLWAEQGPFGLTLAAVDSDFRDAFGRTSTGHVGFSDLWQDFTAHGRMTHGYDEAGPGNVALAGELPTHARLAMAFSTSKEAAATLALASLAQPFDTLVAQQTTAWEQWHEAREMRVPQQDLDDELMDQYRTSAMVLKCHRDKTFAGAMVASLSVPWGNTGEERGGYHLVWPRDLVESATALLALGGEPEALNVLRYLIATQNVEGYWHQNQWLGGKPYWTGIQLDETAFPVLLAAALSERGCLDGTPVREMVRRALGFIVREGPASPQDRWEEDAGVNPFTLAVCIAALVAGAELLSGCDAELALATAGFWNARLESWTVTHDSALAQRYGIDGHFVREAPTAVVASPHELSRALPIKNRSQDPNLPAGEQVALDFLQLVRLGLRRADDPLIVDTVKLADALLRSDTPSGPVWHRYNGDGYGEDADGHPFDGTGIGRGWPLLTGERGHYALAAGGDPTPYLKAMAAMAGRGGMLPEQVWDTNPIVERQLYPGRPTGSAMPLAWAHSEFVKLAASLQLGRPFDRLDCVWRRLQGRRPDPGIWIWTPGAPIAALAEARDLLVLLPYAATLHLGFDGWQRVRDIACESLGLDLYGARIPADDLVDCVSLEFTWFRHHDGVWQGEDFSLDIMLADTTETQDETPALAV